MYQLLRDGRSVLPRWPVLPGRREPDLERVAGHLQNVLDVRATIVSLISAAGQVVPGAGGRWDGGRSLPLAWPLCSEVVRTRRPLLVDNVHSWTAPAGAFGPVVPWLGAYAGVPLTGEDGGVIGAVSALADRSRRWGQHDVDLLEETAGRCRDLVRLRAAQIALEQCVSDAAWARSQARRAAERAETDLIRAAADNRRQQLVRAVADALAEVVGTATDEAEICAAVEAVLVAHVGVSAVRWELSEDEQIGSSSIRVPLVTQVAEPGALVVTWPDRQAEDHEVVRRIAVLVGQALDRMQLLRRWERTAREVMQTL